MVINTLQNYQKLVPVDRLDLSLSLFHVGIMRKETGHGS